MSMAQSTLGGPGLTWDEFLDLPRNDELGRHKAALIDGEVIWVSPPGHLHQLILGNVYAALRRWTDAAPGRGLAMFAPGVRITDRRGYEADLGWWPDEQLVRGERAMPDGPPLLAVEVWSPSNWPSEQLRKASDYARVGVGELWGLHPDQERITVVRRPVDGTYAELFDLPVGAPLTSDLLEGFEAEPSTFFRW
jgi:Uma2 family endonuclease